MIRDQKLVVLFAEDQQLSLDLELFDAAIREAVRRIGGTVWRREARGLYIAWEFSTYLNADQVRKDLRRLLSDKPRWYLQSENRVDYGNLPSRDVGLLWSSRGVAIAGQPLSGRPRGSKEPSLARAHAPPPPPRHPSMRLVATAMTAARG